MGDIYNMNRLQMQIEFIDEMEKLKTIKRQNLTLDQGRQENSAEHSWHIAIMALVLNEYSISSQLDLLKVIKMLLIHDTVEIYAGDTFLFDNNARDTATDNEMKALEKLITLLPEEQGAEMKSMWYEFEYEKTDEAKFAKALDALQPLLNHRLTAKKDFNPHKLTVDMIIEKKYIIKKYTPDLWTVVEETIEQGVEKGLYIDL